MGSDDLAPVLPPLRCLLQEVGVANDLVDYALAFLLGLMLTGLSAYRTVLAGGCNSFTLRGNLGVYGVMVGACVALLPWCHASEISEPLATAEAFAAGVGAGKRVKAHRPEP
jgi:hypothetical protein